LGKLHAAILSLQFQRQPADIDGTVELVGVSHVHSFLGGHSNGTFQQIIDAAKANALDFVVMTEHTSPVLNTAEMTLRGEHAGVLFVNGNEIATASGDRLLIFPSDGASGSANTQDILNRRGTAAAFVAYPEDFRSWDVNGYDGVELYNVYTNAREINPVVMFFDGLWSYRSYPDLLFSKFYKRPAANLSKWDELNATGRKLVGIAGNDAHANVGLSLNDSTGRTIVGFKLDPYDRSFRLVRLHVLSSEILSSPNLLPERLVNDIAAGHCFIGYDIFGDTTGFRFTAREGDQHVIMGDEISLKETVTLSVSSPVPSRIVLLRNGQTLKDENGNRRLELNVSERGTYRVEVYLPQLGTPLSDQPWIISNPIFVR
jgi:hypothetical protein